MSDASTSTKLPKHILVVDVEATCDSGGRLDRAHMEIIELGAVMTCELAVVGELATFVRPVRHPQLTTFCRELTTIPQSDVDAAPGFAEVMARLKSWMYEYPDLGWASWGDYDRNQIDQDCRFHRVDNPMPHRHMNLKKEFSAARGLKKKLGMAEALAVAGLPLSGTHHRGIDDARNIARLLAVTYGGRQTTSATDGRE